MARVKLPPGVCVMGLIAASVPMWHSTISSAWASVPLVTVYGLAASDP